MAKTSGLGQNFYVSGNDLSGDVGSVQRGGGGFTPLELTGIDKSAFERSGGKREGEISWSSWFNPTVAHPVLSALPRTDVIASWLTSTALGAPALSMVGKQINYDGTRGEDGSFPLAVQVLSNAYGAEWGVSLTAGKRTDGSATNGTGV